MRHLLLSTAFALCAAPVLAERIETVAPVSAVTLYPWGASITRTVEVTAPAGTHELVIPGLGNSVDPASLRISGSGAVIGAISVQQQRATPAAPVKSPEFLAAEAEVRRLESELGERKATVAAIRARGQAAEDSIAFLLTLAESDGFEVGDLVSTMATVSDQMLQARQIAIAAETEAATAEQGIEDDEQALELARQALDALRGAEPGAQALVIAVETGEQPAVLDITSFADGASWQPVYDLRLDRQAGKLALDRGFLISQFTGEDWQDVRLTLSTARPSEQSAPSTLQPWFPRVEEPRARVEAAARAAAPAPEMALQSEVQAIVVDAAQPRMMGATVVYDYPAPVSIRTGVDALRLKLDSRDLQPEIRAEAVPSRDSSAYLVAETVNALDEVILPGQATLYADGVLVGRRDLPLTPAGEKMEMGFGPVDGLVAEYEIPEKAEGDRGLISRSSTSSQKSVLRIRNLTAEEWPLRVIGQVPVSTQDDLTINWSASPRPSQEDPEGQRGLLYWDSTLAAGDQQTIELSVEMRWPDGKVLIGEIN